MPLGFTFNHNRSQQALDDSQATAQRASASQNNSTQLTAQDSDKDFGVRSSNNSNARAGDGDQHYLGIDSQGTDPRVDARLYRDLDFSPSRSQSKRYSAAYSHSPPGTAGDIRPETSDDSISGESRLGERERSYSVAASSGSRLSHTNPPPEQKKRRFGSGWLSKSKEKPESQPPPSASQQSEYNNLGGLGRKASKTSKAGPAQPPSVAQASDERQQAPLSFSSLRSSELHLPIPQEGEEIETDGYKLPESQAYKRSSNNTYTPRPNPSIRLARSDTDPALRSVESSPTQREYSQRSQQLAQHQHQQRLAQQQLSLYQQQTFQQHQKQTQFPPGSTETIQDPEYANSPLQYTQAGIPSIKPLLTSLSYRAAQNPEVVSQFSRDSPIDGVDEQRPALGTVPGQHSESSGEVLSRSSSTRERPTNQAQPGQMPPSNNTNRRSTDAKAALAMDARGPPPGYSQQFPSQGQTQSQSGSNLLPQLPQNVPPPSALRHTRELSDQGRSTPPPEGRHPDSIELEKLTVKYKKVKGLYFEKTAQVEQLQNTLANQRLSSSRTSLDDSEYSTRFIRLDGAIKEIAFSIRKDWATIPKWLNSSVNADARQVGTKEMTAVGRASISRWLYDQIFCKCFHPGLNAEFSAELKELELNIRRHATKPTNQEEEMELSNKIVQWKLATIDALTEKLALPKAVVNRADYTKMAINGLSSHIIAHLTDSVTSSQIEGSTTSIIELAVGICTHLARESRDILISFPLPLDLVASSIMKVETGIPALETSIADDGAGDSDASDEERPSGAKLKKGDSKKADAAAAAVKKEQKEKDEGKVRFSGFMAVEVRGKHSLIAAPIWVL